GWLQLFALSTSEAFWDWDLTHDTLDWRESSAGPFGFGPRHTNYAWWVGLIHPDDTRRVEQDLAERLRTPYIDWHCEHRMRRADGKYLGVVSRALIVRKRSRVLRVFCAVKNSMSDARLLFAQDEERRRIARSLHDVT